jgi:hypothetical protein
MSGGGHRHEKNIACIPCFERNVQNLPEFVDITPEAAA